MGQQKLIIPKNTEKVVKEFNIICIEDVPDNTLIANQKTINYIKSFLKKNKEVRRYIDYI